MVKIIQKDTKKEEKILREKTKDVPVPEISSSKIQKMIENMKLAMHSEPDAVAIAASQIGKPLSVFVIAGWVIDKLKSKEIKSPSPDLTFINPKILKLSKKMTLTEEGCLSVRFIYGKVKRADKAVVEAYNEKGKKFKMGGSGLLAQIFQHETDHLEGVLFTDKAIQTEKVHPSVIYGDKWQERLK